MKKTFLTLTSLALTSLALTSVALNSLAPPDALVLGSRHPISQWKLGGAGHDVRVSRMFLTASRFNGDVTTWDMSGVTNTDTMFGNAAAFNQPIG